jgi:hypothetical protein
VYLTETVRFTGCHFSNLKQFWLRLQRELPPQRVLKIKEGHLFSWGRTLAALREGRAPGPAGASRTAITVSVAGPEICIWEVATGKQRLSFRTKVTYVFAWSANARLLATLGVYGLYVWDAITGKEILQIRLPETPFFQTAIALSPDARTLALGMDDTTILTWDLSPQLAQVAFSAKDPGPKELERLWADLASPDAGKAHQAIWILIAAPGKALPFLKGRMHPVAEKDLQVIERQIADLDNPQFAVRTAAGKSLRRSFFDAEPAMREALQRKPSLEARQRLESLLATPFDEPSEALAQLRALEALEYIGNPEAKQLIEKLATGAPRGRLTQEAKASLERLAQLAADSR